jgi:hypothetical protein
MSGCSELEEWQLFLKGKAADQDLTTTERKLFLAYFEGLNEEDFSKVRRKIIASNVFCGAADSDSSAKGHLRNIYIKFKLWTKEDSSHRLRIEKNDAEGKDRHEYQKAKQLFDHLKREFQRLQKYRETSPLKSPCERLNILLMSMNYSEGKALFDSEIAGPERTKLFFLEISGSMTQQWLVDRLIAKNDLLRSAYRIAVTANGLWAGNQNAIWECMLDDSGNEEMNDRVVERLCNKVIEKTVIITVFGVEKLIHTDIEVILTEFWMRLQNEITTKLGRSSKRCLFLLVGEPNWVDNILGSTCSRGKVIPPAVSLPPWTSVTSVHLEDWLDSEGVSTFCERESGKSRQQLYASLGFRSTGSCESIGTPFVVLERICCQVLKTNNGLTELASKYWSKAS